MKKFTFLDGVEIEAVNYTEALKEYNSRKKADKKVEKPKKDEVEKAEKPV